MTESGGELWADVGIVAINNNATAGLLRRVAAGLRDEGLRVTFFYGDYNLPDLKLETYRVEGVGLRQLPCNFRKFGFGDSHPLGMYFAYRMLKREFKQPPFKVLLTANDVAGLSRVSTLWCKSAGVPTVIIQEGSLTKVAHVRKYRHKMPISKPKSFLSGIAANLVQKFPHPALHVASYGYMLADHALAFGDLALKTWRENGRKGPIHVVGSPLFDHIVGQKALKPVGNRTVIYAHQNLNAPEFETQLFRRIVDAVCNQCGYRLIFKLHPHSTFSARDVETMMQDLLKNRDLLVINRETDLTQLLPEVDVMLTQCSTSAYYALIAGIPIVLMDYPLVKARMQLPEFGAALFVDDLNKLDGALRDAMENDAVRAGLAKNADVGIKMHLHKLDGLATKRVATKVAEIMRGEI